MPLAINSCPSCSGPLQLRELYCPTCDLALRGDFAAARQAQPELTSPLANLSDEQVAFLRLFIGSRGNLTEVERTLGVSYPTIRAKLDDLITALGDQPLANTADQAAAQAARAAAAAAKGAVAVSALARPPRDRHEVLQRIAAGQLSAAEGAELIKRLASKT